jgi:hypothetical protein
VTKNLFNSEKLYKENSEPEISGATTIPTWGVESKDSKF